MQKSKLLLNTLAKFSALIFLLGFVIAALDFRFGWSKVPFWVVITASVILLFVW